MADNKTKGRAADRKRLNMSEPYEVAYAKSDRASPARKALLAKGEAARSARTGSGSAAKSGGKGGAAKSGARSTGSAKSSASSRSAGAAKSGGATRAKGAAKSATGAKRASSSSRQGAAKKSSASPAMKRTNAEPQRKRAAKASMRGTPNPPKGEKTAENTAPRTMKEADAVDLLTDDHLEVGALFKQYEKLATKEAPAEQRRTLAQTICDMLKAHTTIEEEIFYPAARAAGIDADLLDEADIEHASAKDLIAQIEGGNPDDDKYDAKVKVLGEYITHHVVEEHTEMFTKCRRAGMDLVALRGELEARKMSILPEGAAPEATEGGKDKSPGLLSKIGDTLFAKG